MGPEMPSRARDPATSKGRSGKEAPQSEPGGGSQRWLLLDVPSVYEWPSLPFPLRCAKNGIYFRASVLPRWRVRSSAYCFSPGRRALNLVVFLTLWPSSSSSCLHLSVCSLSPVCCRHSRGPERASVNTGEVPLLSKSSQLGWAGRCPQVIGPSTG